MAQGISMFQEKINVGIIADWLVTYAGAEKVIKEFFEIYPEADLYSVVDFLSDESRINFKGKKAKTTFIQTLPKAKRAYQKYLPLMPFAIEQLDVSSHNVILSSSHAVSKGVLTGPDQLHISYVHSPIRYAWDLQHQYLKESGLDRGLKGMLAKWLLHKIRIWDCRTTNGVDHFVANSQFIARRIKKFMDAMLMLFIRLWMSRVSTSARKKKIIMSPHHALYLIKESILLLMHSVPCQIKNWL